MLRCVALRCGALRCDVALRRGVLRYAVKTTQRAAWYRNAPQRNAFGVNTPIGFHVFLINRVHAATQRIRCERTFSQKFLMATSVTSVAFCTAFSAKKQLPRAASEQDNKDRTLTSILQLASIVDTLRLEDDVVPDFQRVTITGEETSGVSSTRLRHTHTQIKIKIKPLHEFNTDLHLWVITINGFM